MEQARIGNIKTSNIEIKDILKAWIAISIAFTIALRNSFSYDLYITFIIALLTVGVGFLLHELGHKIVAQRYGYYAEFRSFDNMLILAVIMSFFGFIFAAPGAVMISGRVTKSKSGKISAAGPLVNMALALAFLLMAFLQLPAMVKAAAYYGFVINSWLAIFNMLPLSLFDGYKILKWNKAVYGFMVAGAAAFMIIQSFI